MCSLYDKEINYFKRMGRGVNIGDACVLEFAIRDFDHTNCPERKDCIKYIEGLES